ncbi:HNH endonuclease [Bacillus sp. FSL R12-0069]|uniref:HNH endonuclease n=1 Tax=Bacillus sp. FSL R12-0069 TaxID=2975342 RepID=UPI004046C09F
MTNFYKTKRWKNKRINVLKRDSYQCQECKRYGKNKEATTVHHIHPLRNRPELRLTMRWYSKTGTQYRYKLFYIRGVSDEKTV